MKFGPVPLDQAAGAILAHSLHLAEGRLRKGVTLTKAHVAKMQAAGLGEVTVARLDTGDVHENDAAQRLADVALAADQRVQLTAPFTGRVNLIADGPGVATLNSDQIRAANAVDAMITVATVPDLHQVHAGSMIATIKIISYAVSEASLVAAEQALAGAVSLATPVYQSASLIVTSVHGQADTKGEAAISHRLDGLGMALAETLTVPHSQPELSRALGQATGDIILILTASATSDIHDTAPEALRGAGGEVTRFGIPVDPGNLLFLGQIGERPVIGLPGSARSPVLHGADWVLARVACGIALTSGDFAAMGVGGLLKEIPTRPQPRRAPRAKD